MSDPRLVVVSSPIPEYPVGRVIPIDRPLLFGRMEDLPDCLPMNTVSRRHLTVHQREGASWARCHQAGNGTFLNGERMKSEVKLAHGDVIEVPWWLLFCFEVPGQSAIVNPELERAVLETPDDAAAWGVYLDWLAEHGGDVGAQHDEPAARWRQLGPLRRDVEGGNVQVTWAHGFPAVVRLRHWQLNPAHAYEPAPNLLRALHWLASQRQFRFVRRLELDLGSHEQGTLSEARVLEVLQTLFAGLPALESLRIGPVQYLPALEAIRPLLESRRQKHPRFGTTAEDLFVPWKEAELEVLQTPSRSAWVARAGTRVPLPRRQQLLIGGPGGLFSLERSTGMPVAELRWNGERWMIHGTAGPGGRVHGFSVNGRPAVAAHLQPGDTIELVLGLVVRFHA